MVSLLPVYHCTSLIIMELLYARINVYIQEEREGGSEGVWFHSHRCVKLHDDSDAPELGIFNDSFDHVVSVDMVIIIRPL